MGIMAVMAVPFVSATGERNRENSQNLGGILLHMSASPVMLPNLNDTSEFLKDVPFPVMKFH